MTRHSIHKYSFLLIAIFINVSEISSCSMYKITADGKTMVGNNEDSWGIDPMIWFEQGTKDKYGMVCVGYGRNFPEQDGAMNEHGLAYDAFTMYHKPDIAPRDSSKQNLGYHHVKHIMQQCKTVDEVYTFLDSFNLHVLNGSPIFYGGMLLFVDKSGKYLVAEADKLTLGNDEQFLLANFSVVDTKDLSTIKMKRYCNGVAYLKDKDLNTSLPFCTALSDTMSVNRAKIGDGTLYTSIYDLEAGLIHLNFYHDYSKQLTYNLKEELSKGDRSYNFTDIFPKNKKFQKLVNYKTPQNNKYIMKFLVLSGILFFISSIYYFISFFLDPLTMIITT